MRPATIHDLQRIREIECSVGEAFRQFGMDAIADDEPIGRDAFRLFIGADAAFVAEDPSGHVVAYLLLEMVDGGAHIEQVSRHADVAGLGFGAALIEGAAEWALQRHLPQLSLTTFLHVPWNAPYYARKGFAEFPSTEWGPELSAKVRYEAHLGLAEWPRTVMRRSVCA